MYKRQIGLFTPDSVVVATAWTVLPLVALSLPLDAISTIADGTLTAAGYASLLPLSSGEERCYQDSLLSVPCSLPDRAG